MAPRLVPETQGCFTPWAASFSLREGMIVWPTKITALSAVWVRLKATNLKYIWIYPVFSLENAEAGLVLGSCVRVASNPRNTESDCGTSQTIPDNPVRDLLTQGCVALPLSSASHPSLCCHLLLFQLEGVNLQQITPKVRLLLLFPSQENTPCITSEQFFYLRWERGMNLRVQKCPHMSRPSPGCRSRG